MQGNSQERKMRTSRFMVFSYILVAMMLLLQLVLMAWLEFT